jgi:hypothetical protein
MRYLTLIVFSAVWSLGVLVFLLFNPVIRGAGDPTPPALILPGPR